MAWKRAAAFLWMAAALAAQQQQSGAELYRTHCFVCHGDDGQMVPGVNFRSGFRRVSTDEELSRLILGGIPGTGMPPTNLPDAQRRLLVAYLRSLSAASTAAANGDASLGKSIFEGKGQCLQCHRVGERGARMGPDLSEIGALRPPAYLEKSILDPNDAIAPQNRFVRVTLRDGTSIAGRRLNEDTHTLQLIDQKERLVSLSKSDVRELTLLKNSAMPSYQGRLTSEEVAGVVSYLVSLKGSK